MFTRNVNESGQHVVPLHGVCKIALAEVINYMYYGTININNDHVQSIFTTANLLEMLQLLDFCTDHMGAELHISNCVDVYIFASYHCCERLQDLARTFILEHFSKVTNSDHFIKLDVEDLSDILSHDDIAVEREEVVFECVMKWIEANPEKRKTFLPNLFGHVRLPLINDHYFQNHIEQNRLIKEDSFCHKLVSRYRHHKMANVSDTFQEFNSNETEMNNTPRLGMFKKKLIVFAGGSDTKGERSFTCYDPSTGKNYYSIKHHPSFDFKYKIDHHKIVATQDNDIFFLGGIFYETYHFEDHGESLSEVFQYDPKNARWKKRCPMIVSRCMFATACVADKIFAIGGKCSYPKGDPENTAEYYDIDLDIWKPTALVPIKIYRCAATSYTNFIYLFGGVDEEDEELNTVFSYDILADMWTLINTEMLCPRMDFSAITYDDCIYVVGGANSYQNVVSMEIYNPLSNKWQFGKDYPEERKAMAVVLYDDSLHVIGGVRKLGSRMNRRSRLVESRDLYRYDLLTDEWKREVKLVQYANIQTSAVAEINIKFLYESDFISSA